MKIAFCVEEEEYNGIKFKALYIVIDDKKYKIGTLKEGQNVNYINCIHREYKN